MITFFSDATTAVLHGRATGAQVRRAIVRIGGTRINKGPVVPRITPREHAIR